MSTETELRQAYQQLAAQSPNTNVLDLQAIRGHKRTGRAVALAAAACVLAVAPFAVRAYVDGNRQLRDAGGTSPMDSGITWRWSFSVDQPDGFTKQLGRIGATRQEAEFRGSGTEMCRVTYFGDHMFDAGRITYADPVSVDRRTAYYGRIAADPAQFGSVAQAGLAWKQVRDQWVTVACWDTSKARSHALALARAISFTEAAAKVPFEVGYLPPDFRIASATLGVPGGPLDGKQAVLLVLPRGVDADSGPSDTSYDISFFAGTAAPTGEKLKVQGHDAWFDYADGPKVSDLLVMLEGSYLQLRAQNPAGSQKAQLIAIAEGLTLR